MILLKTFQGEKLESIHLHSVHRIEVGPAIHPAQGGPTFHPAQGGPTIHLAQGPRTP